ncbi:MAG: bifunctional lysine ketoglutarate reductase /saccharopine dehydrogenase family protein [Bacteroidales bacterium]
MNRVLGIRHEDKYAMECRVPLIPSDLERVVKSGVEVLVEPSPKRVFPDQDFLNIGAKLQKDLSSADVVFGVKEMPLDFFQKNKTYIFFSHVIKGQEYNMPMLKKMISQSCNLIDYEKIVDDQDRRLIFFGRYAGLAGMINSLWSLGQRFKGFGHDNPFDDLKQSHKYNSLDEAIDSVKKAGQRLKNKALSSSLPPIVIGFTGYGNVSKGAQEIANILPGKFILPEDILNMEEEDFERNCVYKVVFKEEDMFEPLSSDKKFDLEEYFNHPELYKSKFSPYISKLTVLMNCMYWSDQYPRIVSFEDIKKAFQDIYSRISVIGDITCDPGGSIQCTYKGTPIEDPVFVYDPLSEEYVSGFQGRGILIMAVDILPSELPRESSEAFSKALSPFVLQILNANFEKEWEKLDLPLPIKKAMILHKGKLTPSYSYLSKYLNSSCFADSI